MMTFREAVETFVKLLFLYIAGVHAQIPHREFVFTQKLHCHCTTCYVYIQFCFRYAFKTYINLCETRSK